MLEYSPGRCFDKVWPQENKTFTPLVNGHNWGVDTHMFKIWFSSVEILEDQNMTIFYGPPFILSTWFCLGSKLIISKKDHMRINSEVITK